MSSEPRAFLALDLGSATHAVSLVGWVDGRWRLLGSLSVPSSVPAEVAVGVLRDRVRNADPDLVAAVGLGDEHLDPPRVSVRTVRAPRMAIVAATDRALGGLVSAARSAGWATTSASVDSSDPLAMTRMFLRSDVGFVLAGAGDPAGGDERGALADLGAVVAAAASRRPELGIVLAGGMADEAGRFGVMRPVETMDMSKDGSAASADGAGTASFTPAASFAPPTEGRDTDAASVILAPAASAGEPRGEALRTLLEAIRAEPDDGRRALTRATGTLADALGRIVETIEIGQEAGFRAVAYPGVEGEPGTVRAATLVDAALVPADVRDDVVDGVMGWITTPLDRHRLRDRLRELRVTPWAEAHGEGALLRLAAARAAIARLAAASRDLEPGRAPDLIVVSGGAWAVAPGPAIALAVVDAMRRPGTSHLAHDHARLLAPLGAIEDERERRTVIADLSDDLLTPLGSVVVPAGLRAGRSAGRVVVHGSSGVTELDLIPGGLELVDLPPGESAVAELEFRDTVSLGPRGRRFAVHVGGGLGGLLVDLRDVPLRLPDRLERRRELLAAWQRALWAGLEA